jgi:hypothetical protein
MPSIGETKKVRDQHGKTHTITYQGDFVRHPVFGNPAAGHVNGTWRMPNRQEVVIVDGQMMAGDLILTEIKE